MSYSTLMVHLDVGSDNDGVLRVASALAKRFRAHVIGIAACQPMQMLYSDAYVAGAVIEDNLAEMVRETTTAETSFRTALQGNAAGLEWRSVTQFVELAGYVVQEARAADLVITGPDQGWSALDTSRRVVVSNVVLRVGRPVMVVPPEMEAPDLDIVIVAWKDTREARRAIADALPLLKKASQVFVVEIAAADDSPAAQRRLHDVAAWLGRHGVVSDTLAAASSGDDVMQLHAIAHDKRAGVIVAGAYGHNRLREWVLGGVTRDLLAHPRCCSLLSH